MKNITSILALAVLATLSVSASAASKSARWGYQDAAGPENWGKLAPEYRACGEGKNQSPLNITGLIDADLEPIGFNYIGEATEILNNGHSVQASFPAGGTITVDKVAFELKQVHFHTPSENQFDGKPYAMEAHFVHADKDGHLAVVAVMMEEGEANPALAKLWAQMPEKAGNKLALEAKLNPAELLPEDRDYYRYNGSLTTPPCTEGVRWLVMKNPVPVSKEQVEAFAHLMHHPNNRPVQPVNARPLLM